MTDLYVRNKSLEVVGLIDVFDSINWTDRFRKYGEFELHMRYESDLLNLVKEGYYISHPKSDRLMIVETIEMRTKVDSGMSVTFKGRSLESILARRIIKPRQILNTNIQNALKTLYTSNLISSAIYPSQRNIPYAVWLDSNNSYLTTANIQAQWYGENLHEVFSDVCAQYGIGFKMVLNSQMKFETSLYLGTDRSYSQNTNSHVIFSPNFDNLSASENILSTSLWKTIIYIDGDDSDNVPVSTVSTIPDFLTLAPIDNRESYSDLSSMSKKDQNGTPINPATYLNQLEQAGDAIRFKDFPLANLFDGTIDNSGSFKYGVDFFLGDIVQKEDQFGNTGEALVSEVTFTEGPSGDFVYPTFENI